MTQRSEILDKELDKAEVAGRLEALARRYRRASHPGIELLSHIGGGADNLLGRLPAPVRGNLNSATETALRAAMRAAQGSRRYMAKPPGWFSQALTTGLGAAGGFWGLPGALAELPVTVTVLLHNIQDVAEDYGFAGDAGIDHDCLRIFAAAGPLEADDDIDLAFLGARVTVTGKAVQAVISRVAPRLGVVMGQKLAAQTVPVLGAAAGAATNYIYARYYREMAHVHFGLRRLAVEAGEDHAALVEDFRTLVEKPEVTRG